VPKKEHQPLPPPPGAYYRATKPIDKLRAGDLILLWTEEGQVHGQFGDEGFYYDEEEFAGHFIPAPEGRSERLRQIETILTEANAEKNVTPDVLRLPLSVEQGTNPEAALVTTKHRSSIIEAKKAALLAKKRVESPFSRCTIRLASSRAFSPSMLTLPSARRRSVSCCAHNGWKASAPWPAAWPMTSTTLWRQS
jgi:hypothetical protein